MTRTDISVELADARRRIDRVERTFTHAVEVLPVTKGFGGEVIEAAAAAGCRSVGENYAQDLLGKADLIERLGLGVEFIGQLQSNKVRQLCGLVTRWSTVDRASIITEIARRSPGSEVLVQVNATEEPQKGGCAPGEVAALIEQADGAGLVVAGLMTVGPTGRPAQAAREPFELVRRLVDEHRLAICSMGMSDDLEVAVACGSTQVRLGSSLFGERPPR